jgi:Na+/phosphate symporter
MKRRAVVANTIFNGLGVIVVFPVVSQVSEFFAGAVADPGRAVARAHLTLNFMMSVLGFAVIQPIERIVSRLGSSELV